MSQTESFVFADPRGKRWPRLRRVLVLGGLIAFAGVVLFFHSLWVTPSLPLPPEIRSWKKTIRALQEKSLRRRLSPKDLAWQKYLGKEKVGRRHSRFSGPPILSLAGRELHVAFLPAGDSVGWEALKKHGEGLTHLCPEWLWVRGPQSQLVVEPDPRVLLTASLFHIHLMPVLSNIGEDAPDPEAIEGLARAGRERWEAFVQELGNELQRLGAEGVVLDWEGIDPTYRPQYTELVRWMTQRLHQMGKELWLCVPMEQGIQAWDLGTLAGVVDRLVARLHDENSEKDSPGPVASQAWFEGWLSVCLGYGRPEQWIAVLGCYGYDWTAGDPEAETIRFVDAMVRASHAGIGSCGSEEPVLNPHFAYSLGGLRHEVWFLDASTFLNQLAAVRDQGVGGVGLYPLGSEDPRIWDLLRLPPGVEPDAKVLKSLEELSPEQTIAHVGEGEFLTAEVETAPGHRSFPSKGRSRWEVHYDRFPVYPTLYQSGGDPIEHKVALTFDDGPDPRWTPKILDILKEKNAPATFFVTGAQVEKYPQLLRRILAEGHLVGNHTYTHPDLSQVSREQMILELNATRRLIEFVTGRSTIFFRPPYDVDNRPDDLRKLISVQVAEELGYVTVSSAIDPEDWARPGAAEILRRVRQGRHLGNVVLLHDAGGDRSQTVEALPRIIDYLRARGDRIVSLEELAGLTRQEVMPTVSRPVAPWDWVSNAGFVVWRWLKIFALSFIAASTILVLLRTVLLLLLAVRSERQGIPEGREGSAAGGVSIVIAAYREEAVIGRTLASVLGNGYPGPLEVIVVDDGSPDGTAKIVEKIASMDPRVRLFRQENQGKAQALRFGIQQASFPWLVFLDADTQVQTGALEMLVRPLARPEVGAVSGHLKVGNTQRWLTRFQALEYLCGFHLERKAYRLCDAITVVPGACSAVKREALIRAGGIHTDTLAEDTDLTLRIHRAGYRVEYTRRAVAWTEAPETIRDLLRQRVRWAYGTLQCLWKHRDLLFDPSFRWLAFLSLPSAWFFHVILPAISPWIDLSFLTALVLGHSPVLLGAYCLIFLLADLLVASLVCLWEGEPLSAALRVLPMRVAYRPLLALAVWRAIGRALRGVWGGWGKLERRATVVVST